MEQTIENVFDSGLESISTQLYVFSMGTGVILLILGIILLIIGRESEKKRKFKVGLICLVIGVLAIISGAIQMF